MKKNLKIKSGILSLFVILFIPILIAQTSPYGYNTGYPTGSGYPSGSGYSSSYGGYPTGYNTSHPSNYNQGYYSDYGGYPSYGYSKNTQYSNPSYSGYGYNSQSYYSNYGFNQQDCMHRQDFIMQIAPGGCSPAVVRSDLLEEQNVPVFCKVVGVQTNPLIDMSTVRSIRFRGEYPEGISGVSYFPARAALRGYNYGGYGSGFNSNSIVDENIGYLVVVLSRYSKEGDMPDFIDANITAVIDYSTENAFGVGNTYFYLSEMSDNEWYRDYRDYGFWNGKGYIRAESIESDRAVISIYRNADSKENTITLRKGETSKEIYLGGFYCAAGLRLRLDSIGPPVESALLQINDQKLWVSRGDRILNNRCRVVDLQTYGGGGKITLECYGEQKRVELSLNPGKASFFLDSESGDYVANEKIRGDDNHYIGYIGMSSDGADFVVLVKDDFSDTKYEFQDKGVFETVENLVSTGASFKDLRNNIPGEIKKSYRTKYKKIKQEDLDKKLKVEILKKGDLSELKKGFGLEKVLVAKDKDWSSEDYDENTALALGYYEKAIKHYQDLVDFFPNEKMFEGEDPYAAKGLLEAAKLSKQFDMNARSQNFLKRLRHEYPGSTSAKEAARENDLLMKYDTTNSKKVIHLSNEVHFVDVLDFKKPKASEANAVVLIDGKQETLELNKVFRTGNYSLTLTELRSDYITLKYYEKGSGERTKRIKLGERSVVGDSEVKVLEINMVEQAKISILPNSYGPRSESSFHFRIGIEKRAIPLSPEMAKALMDGLIEAINAWNKINSKLGNVIRVMKAACFSTSSILTVKSYVDGLSGKSMARNTIMTGTGGWNQKCEELVNEGKYNSVEQCLLDKNNLINEDVDIYASEIEKTNNILKDIKDRVGVERSGPLDFDGYVDSEKVRKEFKKEFDKFCNSVDDKIVLPDKAETEVSFSGEKGICEWENMTHEQRRDIMTLYNVRRAGGSGVMTEMADQKLGNVVLEAKNYEEYITSKIKADEEAKKNNLGIQTTTPVGDKVTVGHIKKITNVDLDHSVYKNFKEGDTLIRIFIPSRDSVGGVNFESKTSVAGKEVLVQVKPVSDGQDEYTPDPSGKIFFVDGTEVKDKKAIEEVRDYMSMAGMKKIREASEDTYDNPMRNPDKLKVKYFERAPYKGLPAEIPFDTRKGWYVRMNYVLSGFGKPYDESGRVVNFYICNSGPNGLIEFQKSADDICRYYNAVNSVVDFPGLSESESREIVMKAQRAIADAAKQYGKERVTVGGKSFETGITTGGEEGRCTDFMAPEDCMLMFNVCDPVICPPSRCDLGGDYRVDNVIQSGIIGSLVLCLPNYKEGIAVPICLTGVHAGIDGYISIMNSTVDCLRESIETGRSVGICDEIRSIYLCEFFWKQAGPLLKTVIPQTFSGMYGQGTRGGGEYATVQTAWDNTQGAINYFQNEYAVNSMRAFQSRSTDQIGVDVCKSFVSSSFPSSLFAFDAWIEPDSPVQFHAWFYENQLTTASVPPTSHYKVYYHIYSGKDMGASYVVYLKNLPDMGYIHSTGSRVVARGYVPRGSQADEAVDFTGPSGFKQLCISVNGREECGFGRVSTSYFLNSMSDRYVEEQTNTQITTSEDCVAGTPSYHSLINPNLQAGIEETMQPALYNKGIVRVCSTENPGKQINSSGDYDGTGSSFERWKEVGYCDDPTIKCWLDLNSVKDVVVNKQVEQKIVQGGGSVVEIWPQAQSRAVADEAERMIQELLIDSEDNRATIESKITPIVTRLKDLIKYGTTNVDKARGQYILANLYAKISLGLYGRNPNNTLSLNTKSYVSSNEKVIVDEVLYDDIEDSSESSEEDVIVDEITYEDIEEGTKVGYYVVKKRGFLGTKFVIYRGNTATDYYITREADSEEIDYLIKREDWLLDSDVGEIRNSHVYVFSDFRNFLPELDGKFFDSESGKFISQNSESETAVFSDSMLKQDINIEIKRYEYGGHISIMYRYSNGNWISKDSSFVNKKLDYANGVRELVGLMEYSDWIYIHYGNQYWRWDKKNRDSKKLSEEVLNKLKELKV
ncbi:hypothetical protein GF386_01615 [Candidatus Pacearchaeota archaeon]|nr:hypothetical protein [Candidatus Pacearchaeota archaeon]MBD3282877.1 hypothetical protein [Candidatus Pacearchaeota archaeon]